MSLTERLTPTELRRRNVILDIVVWCTFATSALVALMASYEINEQADGNFWENVLPSSVLQPLQTSVVIEKTKRKT